MKLKHFSNFSDGEKMLLRKNAIPMCYLTRNAIYRYAQIQNENDDDDEMVSKQVFDERENNDDHPMTLDKGMFFK